MAKWIKVCSVQELSEGQLRGFEIEGQSLVVVNLAGKFYALQDCCSHADAQLSEGELQGSEIECPLHFARFDVCTGKATAAPASEAVKTYPVRIAGDAIEVEL